MGMAVMGDEETGSGGNVLKRLFHNPSHQKKPLRHSMFQFLLLLCLMLGILCYSLSSSSLWQSFQLYNHYLRFSSLTNQVNLPSPYRINPKHGLQPNETLETTEIPTEATTIQPTESTTVPGIQYHQGHPHNYHFIIDNKDVCKTKNPFLVLMVPVRNRDLEARDSIRQTWGKESLVQGEVVLTLFMLGSFEGSDFEQQQERLKEENLKHHDLIQSNFIDSYRNLTIKTLVIMHWLATRCPTAAYAMKIDSDMLLNIDNLVIMLQKPDIPKTSYITGRLKLETPVVRSKNSKWYVPVEMYPQSKYPPYPQGAGYVFSNDLPRKFVNVSKSINYFNIEDAYIGMCMKELGIRCTRPPVPSQFNGYYRKYDRCKFSKLITYNVWSPQQLVNIWTDLKKPEPPCADNDSEK